MVTTTIDETTTEQGARRPKHRQALRGLVVAATLLVVAAASIAFALGVTPAQPVSVLGQTVAVGTTPPTLSASGPGEVVLFGQRFPTQVHFVGPVRPRLMVTDISITGSSTSDLRDRTVTIRFSDGRELVAHPDDIVGGTATQLYNLATQWRKAVLP